MQSNVFMDLIPIFESSLKLLEFLKNCATTEIDEFRY
jgi:hypothetical protein